MSHPAAVVSCAGQVTRHVSCPQTNARPIKFKVMSITNFRFLLWYQLNWTSLHVVYCRLRTAPPRSPLGVLPRFSCKKPKLFFFVYLIKCWNVIMGLRVYCSAHTTSSSSGFRSQVNKHTLVLMRSMFCFLSFFKKKSYFLFQIKARIMFGKDRMFSSALNT